MSGERLSARTRSRTERLAGWGRTGGTAAIVEEPITSSAVQAMLDARPIGGVIARGLGRSYGDPAQNHGGTVARMTKYARVRKLDIDGGLVTVDAGVDLASLSRYLLPFGRALPVIPGTGHVTVSGAIAADVHGKNHPDDGSFTDHVTDLTLQTPAREYQVGPDHGSQAFWATAGGMGLTGIITSAILRVMPVATGWIKTTIVPCADLDQLMAHMAAPTNHRYSVAWIDGMASGARLGRAILSHGDWASADQIPASLRSIPLRTQTPSTVPAPLWCRSRLLNGAAICSFNKLRYQRARRSRGVALVAPAAFFHPLDRIGGWNRLYGPCGLVQYHFVVPFGSTGEHAVRYIIERLVGTGWPLPMTVLKRLGHGHSYLSFPRPGWSLAIDLPARIPGLTTLLDQFDQVILNAGGRLYLAKDSRAQPATIAAMYPDLDAWRQIRAGLDPYGVLRSDQARRLRLIEER